MDLPIRYFDREEYQKMVLALLELTRCTHLVDQIKMSAYFLKTELDNQAALAKDIILKRGSEWAERNMIQILVDHYQPKNARFSVDIYGILMTVRTENDSYGMFLETKRVWDKTNAANKDHLIQILKV